MVCVVNPMGMRGLEGLIGFTVDEFIHSFIQSMIHSFNQ